MLGLSSFFKLLVDAETGFETSELLVYAFAPIAVAALVFWIGIKLQHAGKPKWLKWLAVVPLIAGVIFGMTPLRLFYFDQIYYDLHGGTWKKGLFHASGVIFSVLGGVGLVVWNKWLNRQKFDEL